eukprot:525964-Amphidinium_carterae.1
MVQFPEKNILRSKTVKDTSKVLEQIKEITVDTVLLYFPVLGHLIVLGEYEPGDEAEDAEK